LASSGVSTISGRIVPTLSSSASSIRSVGIALAWLTFGNEILPLLFPLASGFALVGPVPAVGLYEMSRRREQGIPITWADAFGAIRSPAFGAILVLGLVLLAIFLLWLLAATCGRNPWSAYRASTQPMPSAAIVPVDCFFEWRAIKGARAKQPYAVAMRDRTPFAIAGLLSPWGSIESVVKSCRNNFDGLRGTKSPMNGCLNRIGNPVHE
jgi:hypothetical protein